MDVQFPQNYWPDVEATRQQRHQARKKQFQPHKFLSVSLFPRHCHFTPLSYLSFRFGDVLR